MSDSSQIARSLISALGADGPGPGTLLSYLPNGVYRAGNVPAGVTRFVVVSLVIGHDTGMFNGRAFEQPMYLVKAVEKATSPANAEAAAARIDALLEFGTLTVPGYKVSSIRRDEPIEFTEVDDVDKSIWQHRGGYYVVTASPGV